MWYMFPLSKFKLAGSVSWCCVAFQIIMNELIWKFLVAYAVIKDSKLLACQLLISLNWKPLCVCLCFIFLSDLQLLWRIRFRKVCP